MLGGSSSSGNSSGGRLRAQASGAVGQLAVEAAGQENSRGEVTTRDFFRVEPNALDVGLSWPSMEEISLILL